MSVGRTVWIDYLVNR